MTHELLLCCRSAKVPRRNVFIATINICYISSRERVNVKGVYICSHALNHLIMSIYLFLKPQLTLT